MPTTLKVILLESQDSGASQVEHLLAQSKHTSYVLTRERSVQPLLARLRVEHFDILIVSLCVSDNRGLIDFESILTAAPHLPIIIQSESEEEFGFTALAAGAQDYLVQGEFDHRLLERAIRYAMERKFSERALRESEERYAAAVRGANDGIWDWDRRKDEVYLSPRWSQILGYPMEPRVVSPIEWEQMLHPHDAQRVVEAVRANIAGLTTHLECEHRALNSEGDVVWVLTRGMAYRDSSGTVVRMTGSMSDITKRKQVEAKILHDTLHDELTGLPNRTRCLEQLNRAMRRARMLNARNCAFLFIDVDRFKLVNDGLGHNYGDALLKAIAERLKQLARPGDTLVRLRGDEFGLLLEELEHDGAAEAVAQQIQATLEQPFNLRGQELYVTASIGIALNSPHYHRPEDLLRDADLAMHQAKREGKARYQLCDTKLLSDAQRRLQIETALRQALTRNEFELHYQPIVDLNTHRVLSFEALIRWRRDGRSVPPDNFIHVAEDTGLIVPIGAWVLREATHALARWSPTGETSMSVNLSPRQFIQKDIVDYIQRALDETGLPAHRLTVEITEGVFIKHQERATRIFDALKRLGVSIHLDDFGTGYSSLGYLRRFPVDSIKIDRSFLQDDGHLEIVQAVVGLGQTLGIQVIAEGVETTSQLQALREIGCRLGQGYLFARPQPAARSLGMRSFEPHLRS